MNTDNNQKKLLYLVNEKKLAVNFPDVNTALTEPNGLLAIGGSLSKKRLLDAYKKGIFPWFNNGQPILWWSPNPRCILRPDEIHISHSLKKKLNRNKFKVTYNNTFINVINECSKNRNNNTWLTSDMKKAFINLHESGYAHSVECWHDRNLVGGLYGIAMGKIFFGESMFSRVSDTSKIALVHLAQKLKKLNFKLIDCQIESNHLCTLGAKLIEREKFTEILNQFCNLEISSFE